PGIGQRRGRRSPVHPDQGGVRLCPRAVPGAKCVSEPWSAGGGGTAADAGGERYFAGLVDDGWARLLFAATAGYEILCRNRDDAPEGVCPLRWAVRSDPGASARADE